MGRYGILRTDVKPLGIEYDEGKVYRLLVTGVYVESRDRLLRNIEAEYLKESFKNIFGKEKGEWDATVLDMLYLGDMVFDASGAVLTFAKMSKNSGYEHAILADGDVRWMMENSISADLNVFGSYAEMYGRIRKHGRL
jgi:hypothetical protein